MNLRNGCELKKDMFIKNLTMKRLLLILGIFVLFFGSSCGEKEGGGNSDGFFHYMERTMDAIDRANFLEKQKHGLKKELTNKEKKIQKTEYYKIKQSGI